MSQQSFENESAFPRPSTNDTHPGLSKLEAFTMAAMAAFIYAEPERNLQFTAADAVLAAKTTLLELSKQ